MKKKRFKKQIVHVETMGLTIYCETELGQYKKECEDISIYGYDRYEFSMKKKDRWCWCKLQEDEGTSGIAYVALLPPYHDQQGVVNFCASLAVAVVEHVTRNTNNASMIGRVAGVIYANLQTEEVETKE